jgi:hypothetical protein
MFWVMVAVAGVLGVFAVKFIAAQTQIAGLKTFADTL